MTLKVKDILSLKELEGSTLVAGSRGLERNVSNVSIMETYDAFNWYRGGELIFTSGYFIEYDNDRENRDLIRSLCSKNIAGLGIKTKRALSKIPDVMINEADKLDFPLINIPNTKHWVDIIPAVMIFILDHQLNLLQQSEKIYSTFIKNVLKYSFKGICSTLANFLNSNVILLEQNLKLIEYAIVDKNIDKKILHPDKTFVNLERIKQSSTIIPIKIDNQAYGYFIIWDTKRFNWLGRRAIEHAVSITAMEFIKRKAIREVERRHCLNLFDELLFGEWKEREFILTRAKMLGFNLERFCNIMIFKINTSNKYNIKKENEELFNEVSYKIRELFFNKALVTNKGSNVVALLSDTHPLEKIKLLHLASSIKNKVENKLKGCTISVGIGGSYDIEEISKSYKEALKALKLEKYIKNSRVVHFEDIVIYRFLDSIKDKASLKALVDEVLGKIPEEGFYLPTIQSFIKYNGDKKKVARDLYIHRSTLRYRLSEIKQKLNIDLEDPEKRLTIALALKAKELLTIYNSTTTC